MEIRSKQTLLLCSAAAVLAALGVFVLQSVANSRWGEMEAQMTAGRRQWEKRDFSRPALWGETRPGSAFVEYDRAMALAAARRSDHERLIDLMHRPETVTRDEVAVLRSRWSPVLAAMRAGAHREDARVPVVFEDGFDDQIANLLDSRWIVNLAMIEARELVAAGRGKQAVELMTDAATFGADHLRSPFVIEQMIGIALVAIACEQAWPDERLQQLDREGLELLARSLRRLDESLPRTLPLDGEALLLAHTLASPEGFEELSYGWLDTWNYGFSSRWMRADAVLEVAWVIDELRKSEDRRWPQREQVIDELNTTLEQSPNPIVRHSWPNLLNVERNLRNVVARLRMLRMAVDVRLGRAPERLSDPLGPGLLDAIETDGGLQFRSAGLRRNRRLQRQVAAPR